MTRCRRIRGKTSIRFSSFTGGAAKLSRVVWLRRLCSGLFRLICFRVRRVMLGKRYAAGFTLRIGDAEWVHQSRYQRFCRWVLYASLWRVFTILGFDLLTESPTRVPSRGNGLCGPERFFREETNKIETLVFRSHFWQHLLIQFSEVAFALFATSIPMRQSGVRFVYELWIARFPLMGGADGGLGKWQFVFWHECRNATRSRLRALENSAVWIFFRIPGIKTVPVFLLYTWAAPFAFGWLWRWYETEGASDE